MILAQRLRQVAVAAGHHRPHPLVRFVFAADDQHGRRADRLARLDVLAHAQGLGTPRIRIDDHAHVVARDQALECGCAVVGLLDPDGMLRQTVVRERQEFAIGPDDEHAIHDVRDGRGSGHRVGLTVRRGRGRDRAHGLVERHDHACPLERTGQHRPFGAVVVAAHQDRRNVPVGVACEQIGHRHRIVGIDEVDVGRPIVQMADEARRAFRGETEDAAQDELLGGVEAERCDGVGVVLHEWRSRAFRLWRRHRSRPCGVAAR